MGAKGCATKVCDCNVTMLNTGTDCMPAMKVSKKLMFAPVFDSTGARNGLDLTTTINTATFTDWINDTDPSQRLYPSPELKNIEDKRGDAIRETFADNTSIFVKEGVRTFQGWIVPPFASTVLVGKLNAVRCNDMGVYLVDRLGSLIGVISEDGSKLYPIRLDSASFSAVWVPPTDTTEGKVQINFNFHPDEEDSCLRMLTAAEATNANLLVLRGLLDVHATYSNIATTGFTVELKTDFGTGLTPTRVKGLQTADFVSSATSTTSKIRRTNNTPADVSITVAEGTGTNAGIYTVTLGTTATSADTLNPKIVKAGFDFSDVNDDTVTIP